MKARFDPAKTMRIELGPDEDGEARGVDSTRVSFCTRDAHPGPTSFADRLRQDGDAPATAYDRLLQSIYDAVLITDCYGIIVDHNQRACDFFRYSAEELNGMRIIRLLSGVDEEIMASIRQNLMDRRYTLIEGSSLRKDGTTFPSEVAVNRLDIESEGRLCFFVRDISVRKRAQDALEDAIERLEAHDRARSQFVSNVSHELRTPLTSMIYAVSNMARGVAGPLTDKQIEYMDMLQGDCRRMLATVNDILDLRKLEMKQLTLAKTRVPFARLVERSIESLRVQARQKEVALDVLPPDRAWFVACDTQKIERVVLNLVGNAIKFTSEGGRVSVALQPVPGSDSKLTLTVTDNGIGIPPEALPHVTERYFTVGDQPSGSGLGLSISREIVLLHGGDLRVESPPPGQTAGTRVSVELDSVDAPRILVVDDDAEARESLAAQLGRHGFTVDTCISGEDAYTSIVERQPDVIVLDLMLPDMDGTELIMRLKTEGERSWIPVIVLTGANISWAKAGILRNFGIPAIAKPWKSDELVEHVESAFFGRVPFVDQRKAVTKPESGQASR